MNKSCFSYTNIIFNPVTAIQPVLARLKKDDEAANNFIAALEAHKAALF